MSYIINQGLKSDKYGMLKWIGHLSFISYIIFSLVYFQERLLNNDAAYYTFHVVNYESFFVKHNRYISYFTQSIPILLIKSGASLKTVMQAYSIMPALWFYAMYLFCVYYMKNLWGGLFIIMCLVLSMRYKFYAGHTEITFAIAVASCLIVWIVTDKSNWKNWKAHYTYIGTVIFSAWLYIIHPIIVVPLMMVLCYDLYIQNKWKDKWNWASLITILTFFAIRYLIVFTDGYESEKVGLLTQIKEIFRNPNDYYVFDILYDYFDHYILISSIAFLLALICIVWHKKFLECLYFLICWAVLSVLIIATHAYLVGDIFIMIDGYVAMYAMIFSIAIFRAAYLNQLFSKFLKPLVVSLLLISFVKIQKIHGFYENRLDMYKQLLADQGEQGVSKIFLNYDRFDWGMFWFPYEVPFESLICSTLDPDVQVGTIFIDDQNRGEDKVLEEKRHMIGFYGGVKLNERFFDLDSSDYKVVLEVPWKAN